VNNGADLLSDDELLTALAASFPIEPVEPDAASLHRLSMAVAELRRATTPVPIPAAARRAHWSLPRRLSPVVLASAVVGVVGAGTGISFAVGAPLPAAVRSIARTVGLAKPATPTTMPTATAPAPGATVSATRQAEATLHQALTESDPPRAVVAHDGTVLAHRLVRMGGRPKAGSAGTTADGQHLLNEACRQLEGSGQSGAGSVTTHTGGNGATFPGCGPVGIWRYPSGPTTPSSTVPPTTTRTTELPSSSHPGAGTHGGPVKAPVGPSSGTRTGGVPTGGSTGTTRSTGTPRTTGTAPATTPSHFSGGSPGGDGGRGASTGQPNDPQGDATTHAR
jgi:hypothetical protein